MGRQSSSLTLVIMFSLVVMMSFRITLMQLRRYQRCSICYQKPRRLSCRCSSRSPSDFQSAAETSFMRQLQQDFSLECCQSQWVSMKAFCSRTDLSFCQPTDLSLEILPIKFYISAALLPFNYFGFGLGYSFSTAKPWLASWIAHFQQYINTYCSSLITKNFAALSEWLMQLYYCSLHGRFSLSVSLRLLFSNLFTTLSFCLLLLVTGLSVLRAGEKSEEGQSLDLLWRMGITLR